MGRTEVRRRTLAALVFTLTVMLAAGAPPALAVAAKPWQQAAASSTPEPGKTAAGTPADSSAAEAFLRDAIKRGRLDDLRWPDFSDHRADVEEFYGQSHFAPAWLRGGQPTPQALQMINVLEEADHEGLRPEDYDASRWMPRLVRLQGQHSAADEARFDLALTICAMRYASDLHVGRINPEYFKFALKSGPAELDLPAFIHQRLATATDVRSELAGLEPPFAGYRELQKALLKYLQLAHQDNGEKLPPAEGTGYPGPPYPGFLRLARLLRLLADLPEDYSVAGGSATVYDPALLEGVRHFQQRHGLNATGYLDRQTLEQLNIPLSYRAEQIRLAMERYRWLRPDLQQQPIVVNLPGFHLYAFNKEGKVALSMRVDVGDDYDNTRTPVMEENLDYIVFRPYWEVPFPIQRDEIVPAILGERNYLSKFHFEVTTPAGQVVNTAAVGNRLLTALRAGRLRVRQRPGPDNALGLIKFIFPNRYSVYLHDIPAREFAFGLGNRVVSHGCVHVEKPAELAAWLLRDKPEWDLEHVQEAMRNGRDNVRVNLSRPLPVLFIYTTAFARNGEVDFYRDIYGYDADLLQALARGYPYPRKNQSEAKKVTGSGSGLR